jgi:hypothetical protein
VLKIAWSTACRCRASVAFADRYFRGARQCGGSAAPGTRVAKIWLPAGPSLRLSADFGFDAADDQVEADLELVGHVAAAAVVHGGPHELVGRVAGGTMSATQRSRAMSSSGIDGSWPRIPHDTSRRACPWAYTCTTRRTSSARSSLKPACCNARRARSARKAQQWAERRAVNLTRAGNLGRLDQGDAAQGFLRAYSASPS